MKKLLIAMAALVGATLVPVSTAQAICPGQVRLISCCGSCGQPLYQRFQAAGYDCHGCPIYNWVTLPHQCVTHCAPHHSSHHSHHSSSHHSSSHHSKHHSKHHRH